jgi:hypothetical protein
MPPKFFKQPGSHVSSALCADERFCRRRAFSAAGQEAEAVVGSPTAGTKCAAHS